MAYKTRRAGRWAVDAATTGVTRAPVPCRYGLYFLPDCNGSRPGRDLQVNMKVFLEDQQLILNPQTFSVVK